MVYITGDIHVDPRDLIRFSEANSLTPEDTIIILGDAGFNFYLHRRDRKAKSWRRAFPRPCYASMVIVRRARSCFLSFITKKSLGCIYFSSNKIDSGLVLLIDVRNSS